MVGWMGDWASGLIEAPAIRAWFITLVGHEPEMRW